MWKKDKNIGGLRAGHYSLYFGPIICYSLYFWPILPYSLYFDTFIPYHPHVDMYWEKYWEILDIFVLRLVIFSKIREKSGWRIWSTPSGGGEFGLPPYRGGEFSNRCEKLSKSAFFSNQPIKNQEWWRHSKESERLRYISCNIMNYDVWVY